LSDSTTKLSDQNGYMPRDVDKVLKRAWQAFLVPIYCTYEH
jgi:hypothetical protein